MRVLYLGERQQGTRARLQTLVGNGFSLASAPTALGRASNVRLAIAFQIAVKVLLIAVSGAKRLSLSCHLTLATKTYMFCTLVWLVNA